MTREEAIERIKSRYDKWALDDKDLEAIQCIFPELAESEDERIRKFLIDILSSGVWRTEWPFSPVDCVAYLEKQKENLKSAISIPADCASNVKCPYKTHGEGEYIGDIKDTPAYWRGWDDAMKQKEQKPAEWSEEDRLHYVNVLEALEYVKGIKSDYDKIEAIKSDIAWLKSLCPQLK